MEHNVGKIENHLNFFLHLTIFHTSVNSFELFYGSINDWIVIRPHGPNAYTNRYRLYYVLLIERNQEQFSVYIANLSGTSGYLSDKEINLFLRIMYRYAR